MPSTRRTMSRLKTCCAECSFTPLGKAIVPPSPVPDLLRSNAIPNPLQIPSIQASINHARTNITYLDGQISHFESILSALHDERTKLRTFLVEHEAFLTPARRLFPEILSEIFLRCSTGSTRKRFSNIPDSFDPKHGPLVLTQICSAWRKVAISTPELWTTLRLAVQPLDRQFELVNMWLKRSGACALTVAIMEARSQSNPPGLGGVYGFHHSSALELLCQQSNRWKSAYFELPASGTSWYSIHFILNRLSLLNHLTVHVSRGRWNHADTLDHFSNAPNLTHISLDYKTSPLNFQLDRRRITALTYGTPMQSPVPIVMCLSGMRSLPHLQECILHCGQFEPILNPQIENVHLPQLKKLIVMAEPSRDGNPSPGCGGLFKSLDLPALLSLEIYSTRNGRAWDQWPLLSCVSSSSQLRYLTITCDMIKSDQLLEVLQQTPSVTGLSIATLNTTLLHLLKEMTIVDSSPLLLPRLACFAVVELPSPGVLTHIGMPKAMTRMVINRSTLPEQSKLNRLRYARATFFESIPPKVVAHLQEVQAATRLSVQLSTCGQTITYRGMQDDGSLIDDPIDFGSSRFDEKCGFN